MTTEYKDAPTIREWISGNAVGDEMVWKGAAGRQCKFLYEDLQGLIGMGLREGEIGRVISSHTSKSIDLPVVEFARPDLGLRIVARNNFSDWKISVISERPIVADFSGLFYTNPPVEPDYTGDKLSPVYFEGFPRELVFGYYDTSDKRRFSAEIYGNHSLWTVIFLIMRAAGEVKPMRYLTRAEHRAKLDAESAAWRQQHERDKEHETKTCYLVERPLDATGRRYQEADFLILQVDSGVRRIVADGRLDVWLGKGEWWRIGKVVSASDSAADVDLAVTKVKYNVLARLKVDSPPSIK